MIAAAALLAVLLPSAALPAGQARYRMEIAGEPVGIADLAVRCEETCVATWETRLRSPEEGGGAVRVRRVKVEVEDDGVWRGGPIEVWEDGVPRPASGVAGAVPATVAELLVLRALVAPGEVCFDAFEEATGERGRACGRAAGGGVDAVVLGARMQLRAERGGFPSSVVLSGRGVRYFFDRAARVPERAPRLYGTAVPGPPAPAGRLRFCGVDVDAESGGALPRQLPAPAAEGGSCREKTERWLDRAARRGIAGRTAVGVAWDGGAFVWHAWAEAQVDGRWIPVDPSFRQGPARGPRFTIATYSPEDPAGRAEAGRRVFECWGRARVERVR